MELPKKIEVIYTHCGPDLDACASVWALQTFYHGAKDAVVKFRPANWNGEGMGENDVALDMDVNGLGWKGEKEESGTTHSCFASIVAKYAAPDDKRTLTHLVKYVDIQDAQGSVVLRLVPNADPEAQRTLSVTGLNAVVWAFHNAFKSKYPGAPENDARVLAHVSLIFDGMLYNGLSYKRVEKEVAEAEFVGEKREVAIHRGLEHAAHSVLFRRGVRVIVYVNGWNIGIRRERDETFRVDHPELRAVVLAAGEKIGNGEGLWYPHPAGFLFCRGTAPKAPATSPSKVDPRALARVAAELLAEYDAIKKSAT